MRPIKMERKPNGRPAWPQHEQAMRWLDERGAEGVATWEMRREGVGNPSERMRQLAALDVPVASRADVSPHGARGTRYWHAGLAPQDAHPVRAADYAAVIVEAAPPPPSPSPAARPATTDGDALSIFDDPSMRGAA